ncbi:MAG: GNAT family N-acetyltransferase [Actinomycetota bacterium]|nr:GNAT family N-acetyltransferase [Actinomycetota bacterium]
MSEDANPGRIEIRDAQSDHLRAVQRVVQTTWYHTYGDSIPERVRKEFLSRAYSADSLRLRMDSDVFVVALQSGNIVGFAGFHTGTEDTVELGAIYVLPGMQARGIGGRLLAAGITRFASGTRCVLRVERDNTSALRFYEVRRVYGRALRIRVPRRRDGPRPGGPQHQGARSRCRLHGARGQGGPRGALRHPHRPRQAVEALAAYIEEPEHPLDTRRLALEAAEEATTVLRERSDLQTSMLVGQIRSTAVDLLGASGVDRTDALDALRETTRRATGEPAAPTA